MMENSIKPPHDPDGKKLGRKILWLLIAVGVALGVIAFWGVDSRHVSEANLSKWTAEQAIPTVEVVTPQHEVTSQELVLPAELQAWFTASIHARVSGYVKAWYKDYGAKVKAGDVLAEIDTPDLDQRLEQAKGDLEKTKANAALAEITSKRWTALQNSSAVSQQETDEKVGGYKARLAEVTAAQAYVAQLEAFEAFKKLTAPFDGVVTARKVDVGALVQASSAGWSPTGIAGLFQVSDVHRMRIYVEVPQVFTSQLQPGMKATFKLPQYANRVFQATLATTSDAISSGSRTLLVELQCDNVDGLLRPGSFAEVHFEVAPDPNTLILPASVLVFRSAGPQVAVVGSDNKIVLKRIEIGRDLGTEIEVVSGLSPADRVVRDPTDSIDDGDVVRIQNQSKPVS
jgi:RND family efflux transporter MFP subunit